MVRVLQASNRPADATDHLLHCRVLVGRSAFLAAIRRLLEAAEPSARVALIGGEAGIGKSRQARLGARGTSGDVDSR